MGWIWPDLNLTEYASVEVLRPVTESKLSAEWDFIVALYIVSVATSSLFLNILLLGVSYRKRKKLQTIDYLIISLAINDISLALTVFPLFIYSTISHEWSFGDTGCHYFAFMSFALGVSSMMTLTEIAFIRYSMVCRHSSVCGNWKSLREPGTRTIWIILFPYLHGGLWATGPFFGWGKYYYMPYGTSCSLFWHLDYLSFLISACVCCLAIPVIVMAFSYIKIVQRQRLSERSIAKRSSRDRKRSNLTLKTLAMCLVFVLAWTPYAVVGILMMVIPVNHFPMPMFVVPSLCAKTSITTNPILHAVMSSMFRNDGEVNAISTMVVCSIGKFAISASFILIYFYTPELLPTNFRAAGLGISSGAARIGAIIAPFSTYLFKEAAWAPGTIFGVLSLLAAAFLIFVPETGNKELPQRLEDIDKWDKEDSISRTDGAFVQLNDDRAGTSS